MADRVSEIYGSLTFSETVMKERLPRATYTELMRVIHEGERLNMDIANEVAHAMKDWAIEMGATHFTHWFQPLNGITSEKHSAFVNPLDDGTSLMGFSGKELIQGEADASSFPSGGLRDTFEARGYTAWDPSSPAFIKDDVLCIPTAFVSYTREALDKKTPLLRSLTAVDEQARRVLALLGIEAKHVDVNIGPEQEFFLIKREHFQDRPDLIICGRTLFGVEPAKGQELDEHYYGAIRPEVSEFLKRIDDELWKLAIPVKAKHNEAAPCQHEVAPVYQTAAPAIDGNLVTMELLKRLAPEYGLACLEHEKPFRYVNGSGKHDNWSLSADGKNLFSPGDEPENNLRFLVFLTCVIAAVDEHAALLRASIASAGNDHRLGAAEAPPAIVSIFLGDEIGSLVQALIDDVSFSSASKQVVDLGSPQVADITLDNTDRNRTSPMAFTGNKFELRMVGSQQNLADANIVLNTMVAEQLDRFATDLESISKAKFEKAAMDWVKETLRSHQRVLFAGDGYSEAWHKEAAKRGLPNLASTPEALPHLVSEKSLDLFEKYHVLSRAEARASYVAKAEQYAKILNIEARTMCYMVRHMYLPALYVYSGDVASSVATKHQIGIESKAEKELVQQITDSIDAITGLVQTLEKQNAKANKIGEPGERATFYHEKVVPAMEKLRARVDEMEYVCGHDWWPVPSYNRILMYV